MAKADGDGAASGAGRRAGASPKDIEEFERLAAGLSPTQARVTRALLQRVRELEGAGDREGALALIAEVQTLLGEADGGS